MMFFTILRVFIMKNIVNITTKIPYQSLIKN